VERVAKSMKRGVLADYRAAMSDGRAEMCLRVGLNLHHVMDVRQHIRENANDDNNKINQDNTIGIN